MSLFYKTYRANDTRKHKHNSAILRISNKRVNQQVTMKYIACRWERRTCFCWLKQKQNNLLQQTTELVSNSVAPPHRYMHRAVAVLSDAYCFLFYFSQWIDAYQDIAWADLMFMISWYAQISLKFECILASWNAMQNCCLLLSINGRITKEFKIFNLNLSNASI